MIFVLQDSTVQYSAVRDSRSERSIVLTSSCSVDMPSQRDVSQCSPHHIANREEEKIALGFFRDKSRHFKVYNKGTSLSLENLQDDS